MSQARDHAQAAACRPGDVGRRAEALARLPALRYPVSDARRALRKGLARGPEQALRLS